MSHQPHAPRILWVITAVVAAAVFGAVHAQVSIEQIGVPVATDFSGFAGAGFISHGGGPTPIPGTLDSNTFAITGMSDGDLPFGGNAPSGDYPRGVTTCGVSTGGAYAFDQGSSDMALGFQPAGSDMTPGTLTMLVVNSTGDSVAEVTLSYDVVVYNDQPRANSWSFDHSDDGSSWTPVPALDVVTPEAADPSPDYAITPRSTTIGGLALADGAPLYLRWTTDDVSGSGSRDEIGIDNVVVTATMVPVELMRFEVD